MDKTIESAIDNRLESISSELYIFSIGLGAVLVILGLFLLFTNKGSKRGKSRVTSGAICLIIGIIAIVSGFMQM